MSVLAHLLEERGIAGVVIGLIRRHMEITRPPRGLYVPFQLGRTLGEPGDAPFQHRVLGHALGLLERTDGPVILEDFPDQASSWRDSSEWRSPTLPPIDTPPADGDGAAWAMRLRDEMAALAPYRATALRRFGRTTIGPSGQAPDAWPDFAAAFLTGELPSVRSHATPALALRFVVDDLKAWYSEAAQAEGPPPASRQVDGWFWHQTLAGEFLRVLRAAGMASPDRALRTVAERFVVPATYRWQSEPERRADAHLHT